MATAKQALTQESEQFTFVITPKKKPDVLRVTNTTVLDHSWLTAVLRS